MSFFVKRLDKNIHSCYNGDVMEKEVLTVTEKGIIREAMKATGWNQAELAKQSGYNTQSAIGNRINENNKSSMRVDTFVKLLGAMGYEVVVRSTSAGNKNAWVVDYK